MSGHSIPHAFATHTVETFGARGAAWIHRLPMLLDELSARWSLRLGAPFELSYAYVVAATRSDGSEAVLKVGVPRDELRRGIRALDLYAGQGACSLFEADAERGALLLERVRPGTMLVDLARSDDDRATHVGGSIMRRLWSHRFEPADFQPLAEWFHGAFARYRVAYPDGGPLSGHLVERAEALASHLLASAAREVVLHGDVHHYNILQAEREAWLAIDPKGMRGDPGYEVGPFLLNPEPDSATAGHVLERRLAILAEALEYDRDRLREWAFAHAVMSACWSLEDHGRGWEGAAAVAESLIALKRTAT